MKSSFLENLKGTGFTSSLGESSRVANLQQSRLFVASAYDPLSILGKLFPYLGGSASVVVYSPHLQVCVPCILSRGG